MRRSPPQLRAISSPSAELGVDVDQNGACYFQPAGDLAGPARPAPNF